MVRYPDSRRSARFRLRQRPGTRRAWFRQRPGLRRARFAKSTLACGLVDLFRRGSSPAPGVVPRRGTEGQGDLALSAGRVDTAGHADAAERAEAAGGAGPDPALGRMARLAGRHAPFGALVLGAAAARAMVILGCPGSMLTPDSADYVGVALRMQPSLIRPSGYPAMLWLLQPFHSLAAAAGGQPGM